MSNALNAAGNLIERGRAAAGRGETRSLALPFVLIAVAGVLAGYLLGRRTPQPTTTATTATTNGGPPMGAEPAMEVATAVEVSRPQPAGLDEIVPPAGAKA
jgi:hypothetical protein